MLKKAAKFIVLGCFIVIIFNMALIQLEIKSIDKNSNRIGIDRSDLPIVNLLNFSYLMNPGFDICGNSSDTQLLLIAFVCISPGKFQERLRIRHSWANKNVSNRLKAVFMVGDSMNETINNQLIEENKIYNDIVQEDFMDTYRNLTLKTLMGLKWISKYCPQASFALKVDDDVVVNSFGLLNYLKSLLNKNVNTKNTIMGKLNPNPRVRRKNNTKFFVPYSEFKFKKFHPYCDGPAYLITSDLFKPLYEKSKYIKLFHFEDVYVGMLAYQLNVKFERLTKGFVFPKEQALSRVKKFSGLMSRFFFIYTGDAQTFTAVWSIVRQFYN